MLYNQYVGTIRKYRIVPTYYFYYLIFLEKYGVLDYTNAMKDENDVKMYVKFKGGK